MESSTRLYRAISLQEQGRIEEAEALFQAQLAEFPNDAAALYSMGVIESQRGAVRLALGYVKRALLIRPDFGLASNAARSLEQAIELLNPVTSGQLEVTRPEHRTAIALQTEGRLSEARLVFEQILAEDPNDFISIYSMGVILAIGGKTEEALTWLNRAETVRVDFSPLHASKGALLHQIGLLDDALDAFDRAIALRPDNLDALLNRANLLQMIGRDFDAVQGLLKALTYKPEDPKLLSNVAIGLTTLERHALAVPYFNRLLELDPDYDYASGYRFFAELHVCDWSQFHVHREQVIQGVQRGVRAVNPLAFCAMNDDLALQRRCAKLFAEHRYTAPKQALWQGETYRHRKLRIGYLSPDLREHPVGHLLIGVIEQHDKTRIESFAFSIGLDDHSVLRKRFKLAFDHFLDCRDKTSQEIAQLIRAIEIDVLVDLAGFTAGSRAEIFALRPAPVHVNYLGYPSTMGAEWMDYILADRIVIPPEHEPHYQEQVIRLPYCYLPMDDSLVASSVTPSRESMGLPDKGLVFCSFNHDYKINPPMWSIWMSLLRQHPASVLWLMKLNEDAMLNLKAAAQREDIDPNRLVFATRVPKIEDHLARYRLADVFLDTRPYNAHSTATDVLRSGLALVTWPGQTFASRVAASVIEHVGASNACIAHSASDYETMASKLALEHREGSGPSLEATQSLMHHGFPSAKKMTLAIEEALSSLKPRASAFPDFEP